MRQRSDVVDLAAARIARGHRRTDAPMHLLRRYPVEQVRMPRLARVLEMWHALADADGVLRLGRHRRIADLVGTPLLGERSLLVTITSTEPESWLISHHGSAFTSFNSTEYPDDMFVSRRFTELPGSVTDASVASLREVLPEARVAVHRITGQLLGPAFTYDRLVLPIATHRGPVNRFITVSQRLAEDWAASRLPA